jgi:hypothetical protein
MEIPLRCECGQQVLANEGMAGTHVRCSCGRMVAVPSYSELKRYSIEKAPEPPAFDSALSRAPGAVVYALIVAWILFADLPLVYLAAVSWGPLAGLGVLLLLAGQIWLFTLIFAGNPLAGLIVLVVPILGTIFVIQFIIDHWRLARWPVLSQVGGAMLFVADLAIGLK